MKPEQQRIKIAEACGWKGPKHPDTLSQMEGWDSQHWGCWATKPNGVLDFVHRIPDYLNDLNAMHSAEKVVLKKPSLTPHEYGVNLLVICQRDGNKAYYATAAQRAEAFLKTLGLWEADQ